MKKKANEMNVKERLKAKTPPFWKKIQRIAAIIAIGAGSLAAPPLGLAVAGYIAAGATAIGLMAQAAVDDSED